MGRFNHEAACVDPATGYVYLTEDREDSVLYRFIPSEAGKSEPRGRLQAMKVEGVTDLRNWTDKSVAVGAVGRVSWVDLEGVEAPEDDLRFQAAAKGASLIARGEGIHMGEGEAFVCSTSGGDAGLGQIFKLSLSASGNDDRLALVFRERFPSSIQFWRQPDSCA